MTAAGMTAAGIEGYLLQQHQATGENHNVMVGGVGRMRGGGSVEKARRCEVD